MRPTAAPRHRTGAAGRVPLWQCGMPRGHVRVPAAAEPPGSSTGSCRRRPVVEVGLGAAVVVRSPREHPAGKSARARPELVLLVELSGNAPAAREAPADRSGRPAGTGLRRGSPVRPGRCRWRPRPAWPQRPRSPRSRRTRWPGPRRSRSSCRTRRAGSPPAPRRGLGGAGGWAGAGPVGATEAAAGPAVRSGADVAATVGMVVVRAHGISAVSASRGLWDGLWSALMAGVLPGVVSSVLCGVSEGETRRAACAPAVAAVSTRWAFHHRPLTGFAQGMLPTLPARCGVLGP